jgi:Tol biopolymer transport system component
MLVRAFDIPASTDDAFEDDDDNVHEGAIDALAAAGITSGCTADSYCPEDAVTRAQTASFLARSLDLPRQKPPDPFDGRLIFGSPGASFGLPEIWALDASRLPERILAGWMASPRLSPDGRTIALIDIEGSCGVNPNWRDCPWQLSIADFDGGNARRLSPDGLRVVANSWSGDGRRVWFATSDPDPFTLWWADVETGEVQEVASFPGGVNATWSGDGYAAIHSDDGSLWVTRPDGKVEATISAPHAGVTAWSPGNALAYVETDDTTDGIIVFDARDGSTSLVGSGADISHLAWSADGQMLAFLDYDGRTTRLSIIDPATSVASTFEVQDAGSGSLVWSPNGGEIALIRSIETGDEIVRQVWSVRVSDGAMWALSPPEIWAFEIDWR